MTYGGSTPTIIPAYAGFVNGDTPASLTTRRRARPPPPVASPVAASYPLVLGRSGRELHTSAYAAGLGDRDPGPLTITASNGSMTYGGTPPTITPPYSRLRERRHRRLA